MLCFVTFSLPVLLFAARQNDYNVSNLVTKTFRPFFEVGEAPNFLKKGKSPENEVVLQHFFLVY